MLQCYLSLAAGPEPEPARPERRPGQAQRLPLHQGQRQQHGPDRLRRPREEVRATQDGDGAGEQNDLRVMSYWLQPKI